MRFSILLFAAFFISSVSFAQSSGKIEPERGFAVSSKGDTLFGDVNYMKRSGYRQSMQVKIDEQTTKTCSPRNYVFVKAGEHIFETFLVPGGEDKQFFWRKTGGKVFFYEYQYEFYQANNMVTKSEFYIRKKDSDELIKIGPANFKKKLSEIISDDAKLLAKLEEKDTKFEDLEELLIAYNTN